MLTVLLSLKGDNREGEQETSQRGKAQGCASATRFGRGMLGDVATVDSLRGEGRRPCAVDEGFRGEAKTGPILTVSQVHRQPR
jgi:hypothetical protein